MGIDLLDIRFRIEKAFGVVVSPEDWQRMVRNRDILVGDLYNFLLKELALVDHARTDIGLNYHVWEVVHQKLHQVTKIPTEEIELGTPLESLFPKPARRETWNVLRELCPYHVRELDYPKVVRRVGFLLAAGVVVIEQFQIWRLPLARWLWPFLGIVGLWMISETYLKILKICARFRTAFPAKMATVKDFCRTILATNYREICQEFQIAFDERSMAVWEQLVQILVEALGVETDEVAFHSRLIHDLGMD